MPSLAEELRDLTERLEKLLHEELPAAARTMVTENAAACSADLIAVVTELDDVQRALGLRTFELLRGAPREAMIAPEHLGPVLGKLGRSVGYSPEPPPGTPPKPGKSEDFTLTCSYLNCRRADGLQTCFNCSKPFCVGHLDPAIHPCGDLMADEPGEAGGEG